MRDWIKALAGKLESVLLTNHRASYESVSAQKTGCLAAMSCSTTRPTARPLFLYRPPVLEGFGAIGSDREQQIEPIDYGANEFLFTFFRTYFLKNTIIYSYII